jgi:hypothetical protein
MIDNAADNGTVTGAGPVGAPINRVADLLAPADAPVVEQEPAPVVAAPAAPRDRYRYLPLPEQLGEEIAGQERTYSRIVFRINALPHPFFADPARKQPARGLHLAVRGYRAADHGSYDLVDGAGRHVACIDPVPMDAARVCAPHDNVWAKLRAICEEILADGLPVEYHPAPELIAQAAEQAAEALAARLPIPAHTTENVVRHPRFAPGLHVAPFRGPDGELLVVAIGQDGGLDALWPVTSIGTWNFSADLFPQLDSMAARGLKIRCDRNAEVDADDRLLASEPSLFARYADHHHPRYDLVHICPWFGRVNRTAHMIAVTNPLGCARGFEETTDLADTIEHFGLCFLRDMREDWSHSPEEAETLVNYAQRADGGDVEDDA